MAKCQLCSKGQIAGRNISHSAVKTRRKFRANIQKITFFLNREKVVLDLCTKCIKRLRKNGKLIIQEDKRDQKKTKAKEDK